MGKNNRQRRADKARQRKRKHGNPGERADEPVRLTDPGVGSFGPEDPWFSPGDRFIVAVQAEQSGDHDVVARLIEGLAGEPPNRVAAEVARYLEDHLADLWEHGWQPVDVDRVVSRQTGKAESVLVRWVMAAQSAAYETLAHQAAPGWMAQLDRVEARRSWDVGRPYLRQLPGSWADGLRSAVQAMAMLTRLPRLPRLIDPPSAWRAGVQIDVGSLPPSVLAKVRALLAKAESTGFDAEAEAFTAKAQELMARHRIDQAVLAASAEGPRRAPVGRRLGIDDPYADAKAVLLAVIADANGCRAVWSKELGFSTVFGFDSELDAVDELFTSLLVQAAMALRREGSKQDRFGRSRTTRFRRSFLVAFAVRIGQRLRDTVAATVEEVGVETGTALVPILAARDEAASAAAEEVFPEMGSFAPTATDGEGWYAGTLFGDQADLGLGPALEEPARAAS